MTDNTDQIEKLEADLKRVTEYIAYYDRRYHRHGEERPFNYTHFLWEKDELENKLAIAREPQDEALELAKQIGYHKIMGIPAIAQAIRALLAAAK